MRAQHDSLKEFSHARRASSRWLGWRHRWSRFSPRRGVAAGASRCWKAVRAAADELSNTPAICRKATFTDTIVTAFEDGILERFAATMKGLPLAIQARAALGASGDGRGGVAARTCVFLIEFKTACSAVVARL